MENSNYIFYFCPIDKKTLKLYSQNINAAVAQSVEQWTENPCVDSSILSGGTFFLAA